MKPEHYINLATARVLVKHFGDNLPESEHIHTTNKLKNGVWIVIPRGGLLVDYKYRFPAFSWQGKTKEANEYLLTHLRNA